MQWKGTEVRDACGCLAGLCLCASLTQNLWIMKRVFSVSVALLFVAGLGAGLVFLLSRDRMAQSPPSDRPSYSLMIISDKNFRPSSLNTLRFTISDQNKATVKSFLTLNDYPLHLGVVRKDLTRYQDFHPALDRASGEFSLNYLVFPTDGPYQLLAQFRPSDIHGARSAVLTSDLVVGELAKYSAEPFPQDRPEQTVNGVPVSLGTDPLEPVTGKETTLVYYLIDPATNQALEDPPGEVIALKEGSLEVVTTSQKNDLSAIPGHGSHRVSAAFTGTFPSTGNYRIFGQFRVGDVQVATTFVVVVRDSDSAAQSKPSNQAREITVSAQRYTFAPKAITLRRGEHIRISVRNLDFPHGLIAPELVPPASQPDRNVLEVTPTTPGEYQFYCSDYRCNCGPGGCTNGHQNMVGTITVL